MQELTYNDQIYKNIFINQNNIIKYSVLPSYIWENIKDKNISFLNTPTKIEELTYEERKKYPNAISKITLPYLKDYKTFYNEDYYKSLNTEEVLKELKKVLKMLKIMHSKKIFHADLFCDNIMMDKDLDIVFIDLDQAIVDDFVSYENILYEDNISYCEKKKISRNQDKIDILELYMFYLLYGNFKNGITKYIDINKLLLPKNIEKEIKAYIYGDINTNSSYYFIDIINELIKIGYESKTLSLRKGNKYV